MNPANEAGRIDQSETPQQVRGKQPKKKKIITAVIFFIIIIAVIYVLGKGFNWW